MASDITKLVLLATFGSIFGPFQIRNGQPGVLTAVQECCRRHAETTRTMNLNSQY
jgi:hypothetical protein